MHAQGQGALLAPAQLQPRSAVGAGYAPAVAGGSKGAVSKGEAMAAVPAVPAAAVPAFALAVPAMSAPAVPTSAPAVPVAAVSAPAVPASAVTAAAPAAPATAVATLAPAMAEVRTPEAGVVSDAQAVEKEGRLRRERTANLMAAAQSFGRSEKRLRLIEARAAAIERLAERGHRDRKSGAWGLPPEDTKEPERTERLLRQPFAFCRSRVGDGFQSREGFLLFRLNGGSRVGASYRIIVIGVNMLFGALAGVQPMLMPKGSIPSYLQTAMISALQLTMGGVCFWFLPDADRIISRFAGAQFFAEGLSTSMLLITSVRDHHGDLDDDDGQFAYKMRVAAFWLHLGAVLVPITQLLEQRFCTPSINLVNNKGKGSKLVLCAAAYMIAISLPRQMINLMKTAAAGEGDAEAAAGSATADAGDDAAAEGEAVEADGSGNDHDENGGEAEAAEGPSVGVSGEAVGNAIIRGSKLVARAVAAKEVAAAAVAAKPAPPPPIPEEELTTDVAALAYGLRAVPLAVRLRQRRDGSEASRPTQTRKQSSEDDDVEDGDGGGDDGGGDDG